MRTFQQTGITPHGWVPVVRVPSVSMHIRTDHAVVFADEVRHNAVAQQLRRREEDVRKVQRVQESEEPARSNTEHRPTGRRLSARA